MVTALPGKSDLMFSGAKPEVQQRHALAGRGEQRPLHGIAQRLDPQRIAGHHHVAQRVEEHQAIGPVEVLGQLPQMSTSGGRSSGDSALLRACMMISVSVSRAR